MNCIKKRKKHLLVNAFQAPGIGGFSFAKISFIGYPIKKTQEVSKWKTKMQT